MKLGLTLIVTVVLSGFQLGWAQAANLIYARAGEHGTFTRVVFEFQDVVRFKSPVITGREKFYVVFLDSTTNLPRQILKKTTKGVRAVKFTREESHLTANITLSFPYFRLKVFLLPNPNRVVIDAYQMSSPPEEIGLKESLHAKPIASVLTEPVEGKQTTITKKSSAEMVGGHSKIDPRALEKPALDKAQTYLLALLNIFTVIIIVLLSFNLLKRRSIIDSEHLSETLDSLKATDESIAAIDVMINRELKKLDHS